MRRYLNAEERFSQVWIHPQILVMATLIVKIYLFSKALMAALSANQKITNSLCTKLNTALNQALEVPEQVVTISKIVFESTLETYQEMIKKMLELCISIAKAMIKFALEIYLGTLGCLCTAFVKGCLDLITDALKAVTEVVQSAINAVIETFDSALSALSTVINGIIKVVDEVKSFFENTDTSGVLTAVDKVNMTVASLTSITIPTSYIEEISNLSEKVPDFEDVLSDLVLLVTAPLTNISYDVGNSSMVANLTLDNVQTSYNMLNATCTEIDNSFEKVIRETSKLTNFILIGLTGGTVALIAAIVWLEYRKWKRFQVLLHQLSAELRCTTIGNMLQDYDNPWLAKITKNMDSSWKCFATYMTTPVLMNCLFIGMAGILAVGLQYFILLSVDNKMKDELAISSISANISSLAQNETAFFLSDSQDQLKALLEEFNEELFSSIDSATTELYLEVVAASSAINNTISSIFGSTPFELPLQTIIYCTIGRKLDDIEEGLQWILNNTNVTLPLLPDTQLQAYSDQAVNKVVSLSPNLSSEVYDGISVLVREYKKILETELIASCAFFGLWIVAVAIGGVLTLMTPSEEMMSRPVIANPRPMSETEKFHYAFPFTDPFALPGMITGSSRYSET